MVKDRMKVEDMGPEATPPESKAMAVKRGGQAKVSTRAMRYPGMRYHQMLIPVSTRIMEMATETETPAERAMSMKRLLMCPPETSSTWLFSTHTAGSASTTMAPRAKPMGTRTQFSAAPPIVPPMTNPAGRNPPFTPVRKMTRPRKVYRSPLAIRVTWWRPMWSMVT